MNRLFLLALAACFTAQAFAQAPAVSMDDEPHYSQVFSNGYCRAYLVKLGRLEETKPVVHKREWVRMTLGGTVETAWGGTLFGRAQYEDPDGYIVSFLNPVDRLVLRNSHNEPYRAMVVEIMQGDESRYRLNDPSLAPFTQTAGPGVDPHVSYVTYLTKTSVEIMNVQLLPGEFKQLDSKGAGALLVAMTDLELSQDIKSKRGEVQLSKGDVQWFSGPAPALKNTGTETVRFVVLEMK